MGDFHQTLSRHTSLSVLLTHTPGDHKWGRRRVNNIVSRDYVEFRCGKLHWNCVLSFLFFLCKRFELLGTTLLLKSSRVPRKTEYHNIHALLHSLFRRSPLYSYRELNVSIMCRSGAIWISVSSAANRTSGKTQPPLTCFVTMALGLVSVIVNYGFT